MGSELAPWDEWDHDESLPWHLTELPNHEGMVQWVSALNHAYRTIPALHALDTESGGFRWIDANDSERSILTFMRENGAGDIVIVALNATPVPRTDVMTGAPVAGSWELLLCSDDVKFGGSGFSRPSTYDTSPEQFNGYEQSIWLTLPPLSLSILRRSQ